MTYKSWRSWRWLRAWWWWESFWWWWCQHRILWGHELRSDLRFHSVGFVGGVRRCGGCFPAGLLEGRPLRLVDVVYWQCRRECRWIWCPWWCLVRSPWSPLRWYLVTPWWVWWINRGVIYLCSSYGVWLHHMCLHVLLSSRASDAATNVI